MESLSHGGRRHIIRWDRNYGFWGAGIFLHHGLQPPSEPHSITSRVAYWAGPMNNIERGEPVSIPMPSSDDVTMAITKAACIQAMHDRANRNIPISAEVDPERMRPLI